VKLTAKTIAVLDLPDGKADVIYFDDDVRGFGFRLRRSGGKTLRSWVLCYRRPDGGGARRMTLGEAAALTAEKARAAAEKMRAKVVLGEDPQGEKAQKRTASQFTVRALVEEYLADKRGELRAKTMRDTTTYLTGSYFKSLHGMLVEKVTRRDVAACLTRIKREHSAIVAGAARAKLQAFFVWSLRQGYINTGANPVIGTDMGKRVAPRERVLSDDELAAIWRACGDDDYGRIVKLLILTGARRAEVGGMAWSEINLDGPQPTWTLPSARSKNHRAHTLPLLPAALDIINAVPRMVSRDYLFGVRASNGFANWGEGKQALDRRTGIAADWHLHDVRRSVATRMADIRVAPHIIEQILNHQSGHKAGPAGIYNKSVYEREVRAALATWHDHIRALVEGSERRVVPLRAE